MILDVRLQILIRSGLSVTVGELLEHETIADVISELADRKIHDLSYKGMAELKDFFKRSLGLDLVDPGDDKALNFAIAARNLLTHKRGRIDRRFIEMAGSDVYRPGDRLDTGGRIFEELIPLILRAVRALDSRAAAKFGFNQALVLPSGPPPAQVLPFDWLTPANSMRKSPETS